MSGDGEIPFVRGALGQPFRRHSVVLLPGCTIPYEAVEWRDAIVVVARGQIELCGFNGARQIFDKGAVLCLDGLLLRALRNGGEVPAELTAVSRRSAVTT